MGECDFPAIDFMDFSCVRCAMNSTNSLSDVVLLRKNEIVFRGLLPLKTNFYGCQLMTEIRFNALNN